MERLLGQVLLLTPRDTFLHEAGDRIGPPDDKPNERSCLSMNSSFFGVKVAENGRYVKLQAIPQSEIYLPIRQRKQPSITPLRHTACLDWTGQKSQCLRGFRPKNMNLQSSLPNSARLAKG